MGSLQPLQIDLILEQIFMKLDLETLKSCPQVCSKWEKTSRKLFMRKSVIYISNKEPIERDLNKFLNDFVNDSRDSIEWRFTKFNFVGEFRKDDLDAFIDSRVNILEGIKFENVSTTNAEGDPENWKWKWNATDLKHFELNTEWTEGPKIDVTLALSNLRTTKTIILQGDRNRIIFEDDQNLNIILDEKISPSSLTVRSFPRFFTKDGLRLDTGNGFSLNEFFEVKNLMHLDFTGSHNVNVDLSESHKLETCSFTGGRITGWNRHLEALTKLDLNCEHFDPMAVPTSVQDLTVWFHEPDGTIDLTDFLKLETLWIQSGDATGWHRNLILKRLFLYYIEDQVDLSLLPKSLILLDFLNNRANSALFCSSPSTTSFPNLKSLYCVGGEIALYRFCPSLNELYLFSPGRLFADMLPETVKLITIVGQMEIVGSPPTGAVDMVNVESLSEWQLVHDILEKLNPRVIIVKPIFEKTTKQMISEKVLDCVRKSVEKQMKRSGGIFVIRKMKWSNSDKLAVEEREKIFTDSGLPLGLMFKKYIFEEGA